MPHHAVPRAPLRDAPELLDVDVHKFTGVTALIAVGRLWRLKTRPLAQADPLQP